MRERFEGAMDFQEYLDHVQANRTLWRGLYDRARVPDELLAAGAAMEGRWHLLALSEDWCGDAVNALPVVARWAEALPHVEFRVLSRDENPDLMDAHLTGGRSRSIPVVMVLDEDFREVGWWGPRPTELQAWVLGEGKALDSDSRYREVRRWYARDKGCAILQEILRIVTPAHTGSC